MRLQIGDVVARCPRCGGSEFRASADGEPTLVCARCRTATARTALFDQMVRETIERAERLLGSVRKSQ